MEEIDVLDAVKAERDEQRRRYLLTFRDTLMLGNLDPSDQDEFDRIEKAVRDLTEKCRQKETALGPLCSQDYNEYVSEMVELVDQEAKAFARLTNDLRKLVHEIGLRRASTSLLNIQKK